MGVKTKREAAANMRQGQAITSAPAGRFGPGFVITAAFIGPGTVITCSAAGLSYGTTLLWALLLAGLTTLILQEMSIRLGLATGKDLAQTLRQLAGGKWLRLAAVLLAGGAIAIGCAAFQAGNLVGGATGIKVLLGGDTRIWVIMQCAVATILLWTGRYKYIERFLIAMVAVMSLSFLVAAVIYSPDLDDLVRGALPLSIPVEALPKIMALIGTTVVPYNLFLHSRIVSEKWSGREALGWARRDMVLAVAVGIAVSMGIMIALSGAAGGEGADAGKDLNMNSMIRIVSHRLGDLGMRIFGAGLWAAGMTSAITAPLAAAYTVTGVAGWRRESNSPGFRIVWLIVMATGAAFALTSTKPMLIILAAQALNGLILPLVAVFLLAILNNRNLMGDLRNSKPINAATIVILLIVAVLSARSLLGVSETIMKAVGAF